MSHAEQQQFFADMARQFPDHFTSCRVLEVGSLDINGTVRTLFVGCDYTGVDIAPGPGVDLIGQGQNLTFPDGWFDTTVSANCFEHNPYWSDTFANMIRMTRPGGLVLISVPTTGFPEHGTHQAEPHASPLTLAAGWDYYRNLTEHDFRRDHDIERHFTGHQFTVNTNSCDLYFWGIRAEHP
jgi:SAM-dependent methyltransferase